MIDYTDKNPLTRGKEPQKTNKTFLKKGIFDSRVSGGGPVCCLISWGSIVIINNKKTRVFFG